MTKKIQCLPQTERNNDIYDMRKKGTPFKIIAFKYDISIARVFQIYKTVERKIEFRKMWDDPKNLHVDIFETDNKGWVVETRFLPLLQWKTSQRKS